ncbi:MAG: hypothetical protein NTW25_10360 [Candidatus Kapabacteria bacterium]|nr:hypothetical protein [Candidatus Kapabacteria bacterium]
MKHWQKAANFLIYNHDNSDLVYFVNGNNIYCFGYFGFKSKFNIYDAYWTDGKELNMGNWEIYPSHKFITVVGNQYYFIRPNLIIIWDYVKGKSYQYSLDNDVIQNDFLFSIGSDIYFGGGKSTNSSSNNTNFWKFQTTNIELVELSNCPEMYDVYISLTMNGKGYVASKDSLNSTKLNTWEFDPTNNTWTKMAECPIISKNYHYILPQTTGTDKLYVYSDGTIWTFTPNTNKWEIFSKEPLIMLQDYVNYPMLVYIQGNLYLSYTGYYGYCNYLFKYIN